jgi:hypothetical protein
MLHCIFHRELLVFHSTVGLIVHENPLCKSKSEIVVLLKLNYTVPMRTKFTLSTSYNYLSGPKVPLATAFNRRLILPRSVH